MVRRESSSLLHHVHRLARQLGSRSGRLTTEARRELGWFEAVSPLLATDLRMQWSTQVSMVDASHLACGVVAASVPRELVASA
eukprot:1324471-Alexandrium_andersonii.AAC.1